MDNGGVFEYAVFSDKGKGVRVYLGPGDRECGMGTILAYDFIISLVCLNLPYLLCFVPCFIFSTRLLELLLCLQYLVTRLLLLLNLLNKFPIGFELDTTNIQ